MIEHAIEIHADPARAFDAMTTGDGLDGWFPTGATVDRRPGGERVWCWRGWGPDRVTLEAR